MATRQLRTPQDLGAAIRDARIAQGLTQVQLASQAGVSREWLIGVEQGSRPRAELTKILSLLHTLDLPLSIGAADSEKALGNHPGGRGTVLSTDDATRRAMAAYQRAIEPAALATSLAELGAPLRGLNVAEALRSSPILSRAQISALGDLWATLTSPDSPVDGDGAEQ